MEQSKSSSDLRFDPLNRIIRWAIENRREWEIVTGVDAQRISAKDYDTIAKMLLQQHFYEAYYILSYRCAVQEDIPIL